jgi:hypothetical protein
MTIQKIAEPTIKESANTNTTKPMSTSFLESISYWTGIAAVTFTAAAAVAGSFSWYFSHKLSDKKDSEFNSFRESSNTAISEAQARSAEANARAAEANKIAEEERLARVKIETRLAPRSLSQESRNSISQAVKQFAPQTFDILWYPDDQESLNFANQIFAALKDAGWILNRSDSWLGFSLTLGVVIEFIPAKSQEFGPAAKALAEALQKEGVAATVELQPGIEEKIADRIKIRVGKKP